MALKFSEMIAVRVDLALFLEAAFESYLEEIAQGYGDFLMPVLADGEPEIDARHQLVLLSRKVKHHRGRIESFDEGLIEQLHGDEKVRAEIERRTVAVDGKLRLVRSAYRGFYGLKNLGRAGLQGDFERGPVRLHRQALLVKSSLENPELGLEPLLELHLADEEGKAGTSIASQLGAQLDPEVSRLGELLDERHQERSRSTDVRLRRQEVIREFDFTVRGIVRMAQGMFRLAGRSDLASRIRPILQRVIRKLEDQEAKEDAEAATEAAPESTETETTSTPETTTSEETTA